MHHTKYSGSLFTLQVNTTKLHIKHKMCIGDFLWMFCLLYVGQEDSGDFFVCEDIKFA